MKKITVSLIAEKAQVSPATVSRVLNHRELVKEPTIRRVEEAMRSLGCQIENTVTVSKETQPLIVLNIPGIENVFYQEIIREMCIRDRGRAEPDSCKKKRMGTAYSGCYGYSQRRQQSSRSKSSPDFE